MTAEFHRISLRVPFAASVVLRGGRNARDVVCFARTAADLRVVAPEDLPVVVVATDLSKGRPDETRYAGFDGDLWLPVGDGEDALPAERVLALLAEGDPMLGAGMRNPFHDTGIRRHAPASVAAAKPLEEMVVRRVETEDREEVLARAARVAGDFLLCTDGSVWRRSVGPFLHCAPDRPVAVVAARHDLPSGRGANFSLDPIEKAWNPALPGAHFGVLRLAEALEHAGTEYGILADGIAGAFEILDEEHIPDHDAVVAARAAADLETGSWIRLQSLLAPPEQAAAGRTALAAAAAIHGLPVDAFGQRFGGFRLPQGAPHPGPETLVAAVDAVRGYFADASTESGSVGRKASNGQWREHFERLRGDAHRRFDVYERERLPSFEAAPDLGFGLLEGPRP